MVVAHKPATLVRNAGVRRSAPESVHPLFRRIPAHPLLAHIYKTYLLTLFSCNQVRYLLRLIINRGKRSAFRRCVFPDRQSGVLGCSEAARSQRRHTMRPSGMISPHITQRSSEKYIMAGSFLGGEIRLTVRRISPLFVTAQIAKSDGGSWQWKPKIAA